VKLGRVNPAQSHIDRDRLLRPGRRRDKERVAIDDANDLRRYRSIDDLVDCVGVYRRSAKMQSLQRQNGREMRSNRS
jgi:hypothetical protein